MNYMQLHIANLIKGLLELNRQRLREAGIKRFEIPINKKSPVGARLSTPKKRGNRLCIQL